MSNLKNNRWLSVATLILLVANIITLTLLWTNKKNENAAVKRMPPGQVFQFLTNELQLTEQQQAAYRILRDQHQASQQQFRDSIRKAKDALFSLLKQPTVPDSLLQEYSKRATVYDQQLDMITFRHFQQVRALCDPTQQKKFDNIIQDVLRRMGQNRRGQGPPRGGERKGPPPGSDHEQPPPQQ